MSFVIFYSVYIELQQYSRVVVNSNMYHTLANILRDALSLVEAVNLVIELAIGPSESDKLGVFKLESKIIYNVGA